MVQFPLESKTEKPPFEFMVMVSGQFDYYVFDDFDSAVEKAKALGARSIARVNICEIDFVNASREWRVLPTFYVEGGHLFYDKCARAGLHVLFHVKAGEWLNKDEYEESHREEGSSKEFD